MNFRAIDLFCGCGGLTLGLKQAGFNVVGAVEIDPLAIETYQANHSDVHVWPRDIRDISPMEMMKQFDLKPGDLELLAGCPPCQGFSTLTTLNGKNEKDDPRNDLVLQFIRFVYELRPKTVMMENVPALAKDRRIQDLVAVLSALGYECNHDVLNAANYGVPQRRRRFIMLAGKGTRIPFGRTTTKKRTVRAAFQQLGDRTKTDALHNLPETRSEKVLNIIKNIPKDGGSRIDLGAENQLQCHKNCDGFKDVYGRMSWDDVSPTITGGCFNPSKGRFLHPEEDRTISMREAALLQTFPLDYFFSTKRGKGAVAQMIGNALPPEFIRRQATQIKKTIARSII